MKHVSVGRWFVIATLTLLCVSSAIAGVGLIFSSSGAASSRDLQESNKRTDCRSAYNADFTEVIRTRDSLNTSFNRELGSALLARLAGGDLDPTAVAQFQTTNALLAKAQSAVDKLPKLDDAVDHGYTLDGKHHPPCPG